MQRTPSRFFDTIVRSSLLCAVFLSGCGNDPPIGQQSAPVLSEAPTPTAPAQRVSSDENSSTIAELREQLGIGRSGQIRKVGGEIVAMDLRSTSVDDLSPLAGLPLRELYLEQTRVSDISPLAGMPLERLYLSDTTVSDLSPLVGMALEELNLVGTSVEDLGPLKETELGTLWIPKTKVTDLSPLSESSMVSLDCQDTPVSDLSPLAGNEALRRLHIGGTAVTDVSPLVGLKLDRLILSPEKITTGMEAIRQMTSLSGLDIQFGPGSNVMTPEQFWKRYDAGEWTEKPDTP